MPIDATANTTSIATGTSATYSGTGLSSRPKNVDRWTERHDAERQERGHRRDDRRDVEQDLVGRLRPQLLLEKELQDVGERLQEAGGADERRSEALLQSRRDLALCPYHARGRQEQRVEDREHEADLN